jgi:uncharacterized integral membrane protein (TIGR00698 family)
MNAALANARHAVRDSWTGLVLSAVVAVAAVFISEHRGGPTLLYALLLGMALNPVASAGAAKAGVDFAARRVLRVGVALLGARITVEQIGALGWSNGGLIVVAVALTIVFGAFAARLLGVSRRLGILTGGATAICGASAAIAIAAVLPRDEKSDRELIFTVAGVTLLSTVAMIAYPVVVALAGLDPKQSGIFLGATIHDVAQVVGAGYSISAEVGDFAVLSKLLRVAMLLPVVMIISLVVRHRFRGTQRSGGDPLLPSFLIAFVALIAAGSLGLIPEWLAGAMNDVARGCLVMAIAAVGLKTSVLELRKVGTRAIGLLGLEAAFLAAFVLIAQRML